MTSSEQAELIVFVVLAPLAVVTALGMVLSRNAVYSALLLVVNFFCLAGFYVLLEAQFVAAVQVIVYAGAIMVLFLFVIMFLGVDRREALVETIRGQRVWAVALGVLLIAEIAAAVRLGVGAAAAGNLPPGRGSVQDVARSLFTDYVFPFEVTSILLIVAAIAAMVLARRKARGLPDPDEAAAEADAGPPSEDGGRRRPARVPTEPVA